MKRIRLLPLLIPMLVSIPLFGQMTGSKVLPPAGGAQAVAAFTGGSVWTSGSTGTCIWFFPVLGNLQLSSLFAPDASGMPVIDKEHAYFVWVSDWSIEAMAQNSGFGGSPVALAVVPAGKATVYYSPDPLSRIWSDTGQRSTWGVPIASFVRGAGLFQSPDNFQVSDKFYFSAQLTRSTEISLQGRPFNFRDLLPHGITCFEYGQSFSTTETGSCIAIGN